MPHRYRPETLRAFAAHCFVAVGTSEDHAAQIADNLVLADLRGLASHGVTRVPIYAERIEKGVVNARPALAVLTDTGPAKLVDGDNGSGAVVSNFANGLAIAAAKQHGIGLAVARNSNHNGVSAAYTMAAARAGLIGIAATNVSKSMAVAGGRVPILGTNPLSLAAPRAGAEPIVLDMATSVVARGKVVEAAKRGEPIPPGWALDRDGNPTTDSVAAEQGVILPFSGPKGSGLAIFVDILCGLLSGGLFGTQIPNLYSNMTDPQRIGHFFLAINPAALGGNTGFAGAVDGFAQMIKASLPARGVDEVFVPGEIEARLSERLSREGIVLPDNVVDDLDATADHLGVARLPRSEGADAAL